MTLRMLDSITVANLPKGADAYLGYVDGRWPTFSQLAGRFGGPLLSMAVSATADAEGCDVETGDLTAQQVPAWVTRQLKRGVWRPVVYASASNIPAVLAELGWTESHRAFFLPTIRLLSAHYGAGKHICGPATCKYPGVPACDGTQWTDAASGTGTTRVDESVLLDDFFTPPKPAGAPVATVTTWITTGRESLLEVAAERHTQPSVILRLTLQLNGGTFPLPVAGYVNAGNLKAPMASGISLRVPA
jgi:hypothetical protein